MKVRKGDSICIEDFWYDLIEGGYIKPQEILEDSKDAVIVNRAVAVLKEFQKAITDSDRAEFI
jgi:hypothetical protein